MIIPSVDIRGGNAVQLIGGEKLALDAGNPIPIAKQFGCVGEVAVIDLDAALGTGSNKDIIREIVRSVPCRVGGGIRDLKTATEWLDAGAEKVILGTAARPKLLRELPKQRVIAAIDARDGEVVTEGWTNRIGKSIDDCIDELRPYVGGFLVTFVENEGRMTGLPMDRIRQLKSHVGSADLTIAGGVRTPGDIASADRLGVDAQVGMALYTGKFSLADGFCAPLRSDRPDGLWPTIVANPSGRALGLVYSNIESIRQSLSLRRGVYYSRSRGGLWVKGNTSGNVQELLGISADCDRDCLRFTVRQRGDGFCHTGHDTCFGPMNGIEAMVRSIKTRLAVDTEGSYTKRLAEDPILLRKKLMEESCELLDALDPEQAAHEAADVMYFSLVAALVRDASIESIEQELDRRALLVTRRAGDAKEESETQP